MRYLSDVVTTNGRKIVAIFYDETQSTKFKTEEIVLGDGFENMFGFNESMDCAIYGNGQGASFATKVIKVDPVTKTM